MFVFSLLLTMFRHSEKMRVKELNSDGLPRKWYFRATARIWPLRENTTKKYCLPLPFREGGRGDRSALKVKQPVSSYVFSIYPANPQGV